MTPIIKNSGPKAATKPTKPTKPAQPPVLAPLKPEVTLPPERIAPPARGSAEAIAREVARIRAELEAGDVSIADHGPNQTRQPIPQPVIVSCQVSFHWNQDNHHGSYSIQMSVGQEAIVTTCVTLTGCNEVSLRLAARDAALRLIEIHLDLARDGADVVQKFAGLVERGEKRRKRKAQPTLPEPPRVHRESFVISKILPHGHPYFQSTAWHTTGELGPSAAFAEFACDNIY